MQPTHFSSLMNIKKLSLSSWDYSAWRLCQGLNMQSQCLAPCLLAWATPNGLNRMYKQKTKQTNQCFTPAYELYIITRLCDAMEERFSSPSQQTSLRSIILKTFCGLPCIKVKSIETASKYIVGRNCSWFHSVYIKKTNCLHMIQVLMRNRFNTGQCEETAHWQSCMNQNNYCFYLRNIHLDYVRHKKHFILNHLRMFTWLHKSRFSKTPCHHNYVKNKAVLTDHQQLV